MEITLKRFDKIKVIEIKGDLNALTFEAIQHELTMLIDNRPMVVSLKYVENISSAGLRAMLTVYKTAKNQHCKVVYAEATNQALAVMKIAGFINLLEYYSTVAEAEEALK